MTHHLITVLTFILINLFFHASYASDDGMQHYPPAAKSANLVIPCCNDFVFSPEDFALNDPDSNYFGIRIVNMPYNGELFVDENLNGVIEQSEIAKQKTGVGILKIKQGKLKYRPAELKAGSLSVFSYRATDWEIDSPSIYTVTLDVIPGKTPEVQITNPSDEHAVTKPGVLSLTVAASDDEKVTKVEFFRRDWNDNNIQLKFVDTSFPFQFEWALTLADNGIHQWTARAYDDSGLFKTSSIINVYVAIPNFVSRKKGAALSLWRKDKSLRMNALNVSWYYTWDVEALPGEVAAEFVPMYNGMITAWNSPSKQHEILSSRPRVPILLGMNEPDRKGPRQAVTPPPEARKIWPQLMRYADRIGTPAPADALGPWLDDFMASPSPKIDFLAMHTYTIPDPKILLYRLGTLHQKYPHLPIWITEFGVMGDNISNRYTEEQTLKYMQAVLPELEKLPYVARYAWFGSGDRIKEQAKTNRLFDINSGRLTLLGQFYSEFGGEAPVVSIMFPTAHQELVAGQTLTLKASSSDNQRVKKVEFFVNGKLIGSDDTFPYTTAWVTPFAAGQFVISARAFDEDGYQGYSVDTPISISPDQ